MRRGVDHDKWELFVYLKNTLTARKKISSQIFLAKPQTSMQKILGLMIKILNINSEKRLIPHNESWVEYWDHHTRKISLKKSGFALSSKQCFSISQWFSLFWSPNCAYIVKCVVNSQALPQNIPVQVLHSRCNRWDQSDWDLGNFAARSQAALSNFCKFLFLIFSFALLWDQYCLWQKYIHQHWQVLDKGSGLCDDHGQRHLSIPQPDQRQGAEKASQDKGQC